MTSIKESGITDGMNAEQKQAEVEDRKQLIKQVLEAYPEKSRKKRAKHLGVSEENDPKGCEVKSNVKSVPGVMTARGCAYAGSKGVVWGPVKDMLHISHGPVGCGWYSWSGRRNYYLGTTGIDSFGTMDITSDFQERDIVFGGDKKLTKIIQEIEELFPLNQGISIQSECPIGLIGDDIEAVAKKAAKDINKPVVASRCEGFRGVSQSLGHHIANDLLRDQVLEKHKNEDIGLESTPYDIGLIGDYNIGGDAWASRKLLEEMGLRVIGQWSGDGTYHQFKAGHKVKLNLLHCYRSMNYIARNMEEMYNIPWMEFNFFGPTKIAESLRAIAARFDEKIQENAEKVIARYQPMVDALMEKYRPRLQDRTVMMFVGGLRPRHTLQAFRDLGIRCLGTGYEFAHGDDYKRTAHSTDNATIIYDDVTAYEFEEFVKHLKPSMIASGIKEKYVFHKMGIPFRQMHSYDYSGPYHGYDGFAIFVRDMDMALNSPVYGLINNNAPWEAEALDIAA